MVPIHELVSYRLAQSCRAHRNLGAALFVPYGLHPGQDLILVQLWMEDGMTQSRLAEQVGIDGSTMTRALQRLERYGFVRRVPDVEDTRAIRVFLTDEGRALEPRITEAFAQIEARTLAGFTDDERAFLDRLLRRIERNLTAEHV